MMFIKGEDSMDQKRNRTIDLIKGILTVIVVSFHYPIPESFSGSLLYPFLNMSVVPGYLFLFGYLSARSVERRNVTALSEMYEFKEILRKVLRVLIPFTVIFILEEVLFRVKGLYTVSIREYGLLATCFDYINGGFGPGSYFVPVFLQSVFLFPLIYACVRKMGFKGVLTAFGANMAYEVLKQSFGMSVDEYRLIALRYIFVIACGIYAAIAGKDGEKKTSGRINVVLMALTVLAGAAFVYLFNFTSYKPKIITYWASTSVLAVLFVVPLMFVMVRKCKIGFLPLEIIGKASFHIYLVQMVYYVFRADQGYFFSLAFCLAAGILFWLVESWGRRLFDLMIKKTNGKGL